MDYPSNGTGSEKQHNITREQMDKMTTAELLQLLEQINEDMTEDNFDDDLITACLDALDQKSPMPEHPSTEESWQSFKEKLGAEHFGAENNEGCSSSPKRRVKRIFRIGLIVAIVAASLFSCMIVAQAAGIDVFGSIARWTEDVLGFGDRDLEPTETVGNYDVEEILAHIESWLPSVGEDFEAGSPSVITDDKSGTLYYTRLYSNSYNYISFEAEYRWDENPYSFFEKDNKDVEEIMLNGETIYFYENMGVTVSTWRVGNTEFSIMTDLGMNELKQIFEESFGGAQDENY